MMSDYGISPILPIIHGFSQEPNTNPNPNLSTNQAKRKRNLPGTPDPDAEVIALSPKSLMATNRFVCEICNKGFQRDQNLQLHRRGHNLPWKLKQRSNKEVIRKKVYICPEKNCVHHDPSRALGDLTGIKKHFSRKHGEKKWKCEKCSKKYAVQSDWKAHSKICGTKEYKCDCGTIFSRKDSFITHRAFCDALAEESTRFISIPTPTNFNFRADELMNGTIGNLQAAGVSGNPQFPSVFRPDLVGLETGQLNMDGHKPRLPLWLDHGNSHPNNPIGMPSNSMGLPEVVQTAQWLNRSQESPFSGGNLSQLAALGLVLKEEQENNGNLSETVSNSTSYYNNHNQTQNQIQQEAPAHMSATALLQKAAQMGSTRNSSLFNNRFGLVSSSSSPSLSNVASFNQMMMMRQQNLAENLNGFMNTSTGGGGGDGLLLLGDNMNSSSSAMEANNTRNLIMVSKPSCNEAEGSMTRDFLGVGGGGGGGGGGALLRREIAKFGSMGAVMDLSQQYRSGSH
ncbi:zinc finger protein BALDIBIS-like [Camellia sinensis]|nr:zinc finger protein BALDIBIS-like [Camellia sinensis]